MADAIPASHVFKFVALRPPLPAAEGRSGIGFVRDERLASRTPVGQLIVRLGANSADDLARALHELISERGFKADYPQSDGNTRLDAAEAAARAVPAGEVSTARLETALRDSLGATPKAFMATDAARTLRADLWDRYLAFLLSEPDGPRKLDRLTRNLRILHLINLVAREVPIATAGRRDVALAATPVVDVLFATIPHLQAARPSPPPPASPASEAVRNEEYRLLWSELVDTYRARDEVRALRQVRETKTEVETIKQKNRDTGLTEKLKQSLTQTVSRIDPEAIASFAAKTRNVLASLRIDVNAVAPARAVSSLTERLQVLHTRIGAIEDPAFFAMMPMEAKTIPGIYTGPPAKKDIVDFAPIKIFDNVLKSIKPLGVGDLKVVKQKLKAYVAGEVAHIENILRGEHKERRHRVLDRTEESLTLETETEEETTRDTQTTERFELKKESERAIQEQMSVQAGVTVSGSYGMVTFGAYGDFAYSTATQQSEKSASNFAREVVDKAVSRVQKRTREERITKRVHEVEELNTHGLDNRDQPDHVTGIYRWVDKHCTAQVYNYGRRLMLEFIVPEPAALFIFAQENKPRAAFTAPKPLPKGMTHKDVTETNYQGFIRDYRISGVTPPPPEYRMVTMALSSDAKIENGTALAKTSKDLLVAEGYQLVEVAASVSLLYQKYPQFKLAVGADHLVVWLSNPTATQKFDSLAGATSEPFDAIVPVSIVAYDINSYFVNIQATCQRRWEKYEAWQISTFEKIVAAHQAMSIEYEQKLAAQDAQIGVAIKGQNPLINREIERNELKRSCVQLLMDSWQYGAFDAMKQAKVSEAPTFDLKEAVSEGKRIQFFEQAFEWENLTYLFYPYFWGRQNQWIGKLTTFDTDPLFTKFLQAGAARVVLPVRPGYNDAVLYFLEHNGSIWGGGDSPRLEDDLFISLADELRNQTDDLAGAVPEGDPWDVVLPTTLVYLQKDSDLPTFP